MSNQNNNSLSDKPEPMIPLYQSDIDSGVIEKLVAMSLDGSIGSAGLVEEFEFQLLESLGRKKADGHFAVATADIGITYRLAFSMLAIQPGDEIVMPALQRNRMLIEAAEAYEAKPVLVDIDKETIGISASEADNAITDKTKCIVAIDHEMTTCNQKGLRKVAARRKVEIIHDISTSYGTTYKGEPIGSQHEMTLLSCTPSDSLNCVEGAALLGRGFERLRFAEKAREIVLALPRANDKGRQSQIRIDSDSIGLSYKMTAFHAGIGTSQIERVSRASACRDHANESLLEEIDNTNTFVSLIRTKGYIPSLLCFRMKPDPACLKYRDAFEARGLVHLKTWMALQSGEDSFGVASEIADTLLYSRADLEHVKRLTAAIQHPVDA